MAKHLFSPAFRARLSEKVMDLGNIIGAALIFGQFVGDKGFSFPLFIAGFILMSSCYLISFVVSS